jgi:hypothetical protein
MRATIILAATWLVAGRAAAETVDAGRAEARRLGNAGVEAFQANDFATAHDRLEGAYALLPAPSLGLWSARTLVKLGKLVEADVRYSEVLALSGAVGDVSVQAQAQTEARAERAALALRIPSVIVRVEGATTSHVAVRIDGAASDTAGGVAGIRLNPGRHEITATGDDARATLTVTLTEGENRSVVLRLLPIAASGTAVATRGRAAPTAPMSIETTAPGGDGERGANRVGGARRTFVWVGLGVGAVGLAVGAVAGGLALSKKGELDGMPECMSGACTGQQRGLVDSYNRMRVISGASFITGGVLTVASAVLLLTSLAEGDAAPPPGDVRSAKGLASFRLRLAVLPTGGALAGEF